MPLVPKNIKELSPYKPGKSIEEVQRELGLEQITKLASNENPLGPSPLALEAIRKAEQDLHRYPDASGLNLRKRLAERFDVKIDNVVLGAGSEGIMATIMRTFLLPEDEIITAQNSFIGFTVLAKASGRQVHWVPMKEHRYNLKAMATFINEYTKIIYLANPDNPMGTYFTVEEFDAFMEKVPERVLIIMDEAYFEFAQSQKDYPDSMHYRYDNVITLRTFSKAYGLGGLRIGYGFAHDQLISNLMKVKLPFEPSSLAQAAGLAALEDNYHIEKTVQLTQDGIEYFSRELRRLEVNTIPSAANF
ncbi:MAG TPA: histidinol-phosphate transaminase, partial [Candidatus Marinimicrobia bacterium]|nr:histidinol-phosphate transaminase [Candidatus Neomarinimicrobiota bacterium]